MYSMTLKSVGNPDFGQYAPVSEPKRVRAATLAELRRMAEEYQKEWDLGGGNWTNPVVRDEKGKVVGHFSWNLRFWEGDGSGDWRKKKEILIDDAPAPRGTSSPTWTEHVKTCLDCKRPFRVSRETLSAMPLSEVSVCAECVTGHPVAGERP